jgi:hypothetical protein
LSVLAATSGQRLQSLQSTTFGPNKRVKCTEF